MAQSYRLKVSLPGPQHDFLKTEAERLGLTLAELLRRIIDRYREQQGRQSCSAT